MDILICGNFSLLTFIPSIIIAFSVAWIVQRVRHPGTYLVLSVLHALIFLTYEYIVMRVGFGSSLTFWYILKKLMVSLLFAVLLEAGMIFSKDNYFNKTGIVIVSAFFTLLIGHYHVPNSWRSNSFFSYVVTLILGLCGSYLAVYGFPKQQFRRILHNASKAVGNAAAKVDTSNVSVQNFSLRSLAFLIPIILGGLMALLGYNMGPSIVYGERTAYLNRTCSGSINYLWCDQIGTVAIEFALLFGVVGAVIGFFLIKKRK